VIIVVMIVIVIMPVVVVMAVRGLLGARIPEDRERVPLDGRGGRAGAVFLHRWHVVQLVRVWTWYCSARAWPCFSRSASSAGGSQVMLVI